MVVFLKIETEDILESCLELSEVWIPKWILFYSKFSIYHPPSSEVKTSDLAAHFSRNSGAANTVLFTIQTFN